jgi:hypothetical protein
MSKDFSWKIFYKQKFFNALMHFVDGWLLCYGKLVMRRKAIMVLLRSSMTSDNLSSKRLTENL